MAFDNVEPILSVQNLFPHLLVCFVILFCGFNQWFTAVLISTFNLFKLLSMRWVRVFVVLYYLPARFGAQENGDTNYNQNYKEF